MLFNSLPFVFVFLPIIVTVFFWISSFDVFLAKCWLALGSLVFYGWWNPTFLWLLCGSIIFNYLAGRLIVLANAKSRIFAKIALGTSLVANLGVLIFYKYAIFLAQIIGHLAQTKINVGTIILPLGISFFTFTQITYLVDAYEKKVSNTPFIHYLIFVTYFPHLIAGPILHHAEIVPQIADKGTYKVNWSNIAAGQTLFILGLAKKVLLADNLGHIATPIFSAASGGIGAPLIEAWSATLAYALQIYFDFSGYSDMALGLSLLFNIRLPLNFASPYKATSIIDFWRRWHMTLSRLLRDYLYIPLGGNRRGRVRRYINLTVTMLLGGLWHGAGLTYLVWGGLHGLYLIFNHAFRWFTGQRRVESWANTMVSRAVTFLCVVLAWVVFRSSTLAASATMFKGMAGLNGLRTPTGWFPIGHADGASSAGLILACLTIVWFAPNSQEILRHYHPSRSAVEAPLDWTASIVWQPTGIRLIACALLLATTVIAIFPSHPSEFLYYQF